MINKKDSRHILCAVAVVTAAACAATILSSCGILPQTGDAQQSGENFPQSGLSQALEPYPETVDLSIAQMLYPANATLPAGDSYDNNQHTRYILEKLNIRITVDWIAVNNNDYNQKMNLCIASGNLPDAVLAQEQSQMRSAARLGLLSDITDIYERYASDMMKMIMDSTNGRAMNAATVDGRIFAIPGTQVQADGIHFLWIRKDWLDRLGLEIPRTPEEIGDAARAFIEAELGGSDTVGIAGPATGSLLYCNFLESANNVSGFDPIFSAMDVYPGYWIKDENGRCEYGSLSPKMRDVLLLLSDWYAEGLIDPEMGMRGNVLETVNSNRCGIFFAPWWMGYDIQDSVKRDPNANWQAYPVYTPDGRFNAHCSSTTRVFTIINKEYAHPEAVFKIANLLLRDEGVLENDASITWYPLRNPMAPADECERTIAELKKVLSGVASPEDYTDPGPYKLLISDVNKIGRVKLRPYDNLDIQYWNLDDMSDWGRYYSLLVGGRPLMQDYNRVYSATYDLTESMPKIWPNLKKLEYDTMMKIIMGNAGIDEFDEFTQVWRSRGGDILTNEVNSAAAPRG